MSALRASSGPGRTDRNTYVLTYLGTKEEGIGRTLSDVGGFLTESWPALVIGAVLGGAVTFGILHTLSVRRREAAAYTDSENENTDASEEEME